MAENLPSAQPYSNEFGKYNNNKLVSSRRCIQHEGKDIRIGDPIALPGKFDKDGISIEWSVYNIEIKAHDIPYVTISLSKNRWLFVFKITSGVTFSCSSK